MQNSLVSPNLKQNKTTHIILWFSVLSPAITLLPRSLPKSYIFQLRSLTCYLHFLPFPSLASLPRSVSTLTVHWNCSCPGHWWPPLAKSKRHIFVVNFPSLSKALDKLAAVICKRSLLQLPWHTFLVSCRSHGPLLFPLLVLFLSHQTEPYIRVLFRVHSSASFCYS